MATVHLAYCCISGQTESHKAAAGLDLAIGVALTTIALLGMFNVMAMSSNIYLPMLGVGATYTGITLMHIGVMCKRDIRCTKNIALVKEPYDEVDSDAIDDWAAEDTFSGEE